MRKLLLSFGLSVFVAVAQTTYTGVAHEKPPFISGMELASRISKADVWVKAGTPLDPLMLLDSYRAAMQYLDKPMPAFAVHLEEDELFVVLDGSGTMNLGATLIEPRRGNGATTLVADRATGGIDYKLAKGDMFLLPANMARRVTQVDGKLVMMSMRLPHQPPASSAK